MFIGFVVKYKDNIYIIWITYLVFEKVRAFVLILSSTNVAQPAALLIPLN